MSGCRSPGVRGRGQSQRDVQGMAGRAPDEAVDRRAAGSPPLGRVRGLPLTLAMVTPWSRSESLRSAVISRTGELEGQFVRTTFVRSTVPAVSNRAQ